MVDRGVDFVKRSFGVICHGHDGDENDRSDQEKQKHPFSTLYHDTPDNLELYCVGSSLSTPAGQLCRTVCPADGMWRGQHSSTTDVRQARTRIGGGKTPSLPSSLLPHRDNCCNISITLVDRVLNEFAIQNILLCRSDIYRRAAQRVFLVIRSFYITIPATAAWALAAPSARRYTSVLEVAACPTKSCTAFKSRVCS